MSEDRGLDMLDYLVLILKWKKFLILLAILISVISYFSIYFLIEKEYESSATIIPSENNSINSLTSLMKNFANLPLNMGTANKTAEMDLYNTIIYSRSSIDSIINKFDLMNDYGFILRTDAVKAVKKMIKTEITESNAFLITCRAKTPQKAADMTNYLITLLNRRVIELNVGKARSNREFMEERYKEIRENLKNSEDSLRRYQEKTGVFEAKDQTKATIEIITKLDAELASKQIELSVLEKLYGNNSSMYKNAEVTVEEFQKKLDSIKSGKGESSFLLPISTLPKDALNYLRLYRNVKINDAMLEVIIPLYEQAKFEEQKEMPILQVIDYGIPPEKKAYPPRLIMTLLITVSVLLLVIFYLIIKEIINNSTNPKVEYIRKEIFSFRKRKP